MHPTAWPSLVVGEVTVAILFAYFIWVGSGWIARLAVAAAVLALAGIALIGFVLDRQGDVVLETWQQGFDAAKFLWWLMLGSAWFAMLLSVIRCWRKTGSPLPFHRRPGR